MRRFRLLKNIRKGIEGAILTGSTMEAAIQIAERSQDVDVSDVEHAVSVLVAAMIGFVIKSLKNWLKNRDR
ncbi:MAG: hypothetical protein ACYTEQ_19850 [Planctomycetota bacterium]|jgi:hypothetical protein